MARSKLTKEEKEILESYENGEWESIASKGDLEGYRAAARRMFKKDKRVNIRISGKDLELIQERALIEGIPYQTLMSSILHKYVNGRFVDKATNPTPEQSG
jgi:predicted DNA binding CopG/RHH family protein